MTHNKTLNFKLSYNIKGVERRYQMLHLMFLVTCSPLTYRGMYDSAEVNLRGNESVLELPKQFPVTCYSTSSGG